MDERYGATSPSIALPDWAWAAAAPIAVLFLGIASRGREVSPLTRPLLDPEGRWLVLAALLACVIAAIPFLTQGRRAGHVRALVQGLTVLGGSLLLITLPGWRPVIIVLGVALFAVALSVLLSSEAVDVERPSVWAWLVLASASAATALPLLALARFRFPPASLALIGGVVALCGVIAALALVDWIGGDIIIASAVVAAILVGQFVWVAAHVQLGYIQFGLALAFATGAASSLVASRAQAEPSFRVGLEPALIAGAAALILLIDPV